MLTSERADAIRIYSDEFEKHCGKFRGCIKYPFVSNECVAPAGDHFDKEWENKMYKLIKAIK